MPRKSRPTHSFKNLVAFGFVALVSSLAVVGLLVTVVKPTSSSSSFCANSISCIHNLTASAENNTPGYFEGQPIMPPPIDLNGPLQPTRVLGDTTLPGEKHIFVDLQAQTLYAYQGSTQIMETLISSGKWNPTPPGDYKIWIKLRSTRMSGGEGADAYDLPNVPFVMFFYNNQVGKSEGFSLHGAYWHDNFGHPMSHGCVNMRIVDAEAIYNWADPPTTSTTTYATAQAPGTLVSICNQVQLQTGAQPMCVQS